MASCGVWAVHPAVVLAWRQKELSSMLAPGMGDFVCECHAGCCLHQPVICIYAHKYSLPTSTVCQQELCECIAFLSRLPGTAPCAHVQGLAVGASEEGLTPEQKQTLKAIRHRKTAVVAEHRSKKAVTNNQAILPRRADRDRKSNTTNLKVSVLSILPTRASCIQAIVLSATGCHS